MEWMLIVLALSRRRSFYGSDLLNAVNWTKPCEATGTRKGFEIPAKCQAASRRSALGNVGRTRTTLKGFDFKALMHRHQNSYSPNLA
jgi:hypothetical protein